MVGILTGLDALATKYLKARGRTVPDVVEDFVEHNRQKLVEIIGKEELKRVLSLGYTNPRRLGISHDLNRCSEAIGKRHPSGFRFLEFGVLSEKERFWISDKFQMPPAPAREKGFSRFAVYEGDSDTVINQPKYRGFPGYHQCNANQGVFKIVNWKRLSYSDPFLSVLFGSSEYEFNYDQKLKNDGFDSKGYRVFSDFKEMLQDSIVVVSWKLGGRVTGFQEEIPLVTDDVRSAKELVEKIVRKQNEA